MVKTSVVQLGELDKSQIPRFDWCKVGLLLSTLTWPLARSPSASATAPALDGSKCGAKKWSDSLRRQLIHGVEFEASGSRGRADGRVLGDVRTWTGCVINR